MISGFHHVALIVGDYDRSKAFYTDILGLSVLDENFRADRQSWKLDLAIPGGGQLELFTFPGAPPRATRAGGARASASRLCCRGARRQRCPACGP